MSDSDRCDFCSEPAVIYCLDRHLRCSDCQERYAGRSDDKPPAAAASTVPQRTANTSKGKS